MARLALLASVGLTLVASSLGNEIANELENHYNGYPHTVPNTKAGASANQRSPQNPEVNGFIPLVFLYTASLPTTALTPDFSLNTSVLIPRELNGGPGDVPTYLFTGQKPAVANNYPEIFGNKTRKLLADADPQPASISQASSFAATLGSYTGCLSSSTFVNSSLVSITNNTNSADWEEYKTSICTAGKTNVPAATNKFANITLKYYGQVKKANLNGYPVLTIVFDFTSRPTLDLISNTTGEPNLKLTHCTVFLPDGSFVNSRDGTCFNDTPEKGKDGVPQPVVVRLAAKSFYYGTSNLSGNTGAFAGTEVAPRAGFAVNFIDNNFAEGQPGHLKSLIFADFNGAKATLNQAYGVYIDPSGIYPGN